MYWDTISSAKKYTIFPKKLFSISEVVRLSLLASTRRCGKNNAHRDSLLRNLYSSTNTACTNAAGRRPRDARTRCINMRWLCAYLDCHARHVIDRSPSGKILRIFADVDAAGIYISYRLSTAKLYDFNAFLAIVGELFLRCPTYRSSHRSSSEHPRCA